MIRIKGVRVSIEEVIDYKKVIAKRLKVNKEDIKSYKIHKQSIDARNKMMFSYVFDFDVEIDNEDKYLDNNIVKVETEEYVLPSQGSEIINNRVYVVGAGPAGLFAALKLATYGYKPIVIDRGQTLLERIKTINDLWENNKLNEESNVCFGEGGAGTFSDGKLNTLVKDKYFRMKEVFKTFVECGAPEEIMYDSKPHIGTDILRNVIINLREKIISLGGEFKFNSKLEDILAKHIGVEKVTLIQCGGGDKVISDREQWNDGSNTLCIKPGEVIVYARNYVTNKILQEHGIITHIIPSSELSRGRGGPRCMSMPLEMEV